MAGESARANARKARERARKLTAAAERWERGAEGESRTAEALASLGPGWTTWHDVAWPGRRYANIDHVVVGPTGIFVVDTKNWSGSISIRHGVLRQNGYRREKEVAGCAEAALAIGALIPDFMAACRPVMCFVNHEAFGQQVRDVTLCSTRSLTSTIATGPVVLDADQARWVVGRLQETIMSRTTQPSSGRRGAARRAGSPRALSQPRPPRRTVAGRVARGAFAVILLVFAMGIFASVMAGR